MHKTAQLEWRKRERTSPFFRSDPSSKISLKQFYASYGFNSKVKICLVWPQKETKFHTMFWTVTITAMHLLLQRCVITNLVQPFLSWCQSESDAMGHVCVARNATGRSCEPPADTMLEEVEGELHHSDPLCYYRIPYWVAAAIHHKAFKWGRQS